jgi:hypothetical protein
MGFFLGLVSNVVANLVFWALLGAHLLDSHDDRRTAVLPVFGLARVSSVAVVVSNLWTPQASPGGRAVGYTISLHELWAAQSVDRLFSSASLRMPELVRGLVDALWLRQSVRCTIEVSPVDGADTDLGRNLIVVGGSARNSVRARYVRARLPTAILTGEDHVPVKHGDGITIVRGGTASTVNLTEVNVALIEKCRDPDRGTTVFFCLGVRADGSWAAAEYLVRNWKQLAAEFGDAAFVVCLGFPHTERYAEEYREPLRLSIGSSR